MKKIYTSTKRIYRTPSISLTKIPFLFILFFISGLTAFAQPANDDPCNAINIIPANSCSYQSFTTAAATATTGVADPSCANYMGGDVWFKTTVPCTGSLVFDSQTGDILDAGMAIYTGVCTNLTEVDCNDDGSANGAMPRLSATGLVPGSTVWIRMWEYGNDSPGTFGLCVVVPPPPGPGGSCSTASPFCTSNVYTFPNNTDVPELGGNGIYGCLNTTPNPVFYYMQMETSGSLDIHITQTSAAGDPLDVDFALWGPFTSLASSCGGLTADNNISCSYLPAADETAHIPNGLAGEYYVLLLTNFSNQPGTITFQQAPGSTATTSCAVICDITASNSGPVCPGQLFNLNCNLPAGLPGATYSWVGPNCFSSTLQNPTGITAPSTAGTYVYTVTATTPSGSTCSISTSLIVGALAGSSASVTGTTCTNLSDGIVTGIPPATGGPFTYTLNLGLPGEIVQAGNPVFPNLAAGSYTITIANPIGCSETHTEVVISGAGLNATAIPTATTCPGVNNGVITITPPATGGPFIYTLIPVINPVAIIQNNNPVFNNLPAGAYTITFTNAIGCNGTVPNQTIVVGPAVTTPASASPTTCPAINDGTITITAPATGGPFTYTITGTVNPTPVIHNNNPVFTNLAPDTYVVTFTTALGCSGTAPNQTVGVGPAITTAAAATPTTCPSVNDGTITIIAPASGGPFTYTITGTVNPTPVVHNNNPVFTNLAPDTYIVTFTTALGCSGTTPNQTVPVGPSITTAALVTPATCSAVNNGTIAITPPASGGPFTYTITGTVNPVPVVHNNNPLFTNLAPDTYIVTFTTALGCSGTAPNQTVIVGPQPTTTALANATTCPSVNDGSITITAPATGGPFIYTITGTANPTPIVQNNNPVFTNLAPDIYTISFTTALGCTGIAANKTVVPGPAITTAATAVRTSCPSVNDGSIIITAPATGGPFVYTITGTANPVPIVQNGNPVFINLAPDTYTIKFTTALGCSGTASNQTVNPGPAITTPATATATTCPTVSDGTITVTPPVTGGAAPFTYILDQGTASQVTQIDNPVFINLPVGPHSIHFSTALGCSGISSPASVVVPAGAALVDNTAAPFNPPCANINDGIISIVPSVAGTYTYILNPGLPSQINNGNNPIFPNLAPGIYTYNFTNAIGCMGSGTKTLTTHTALATTVGKTMPLCNANANGIIVLSASGGVAPYQYALSPFTTFQGGTFNGLTAGTYSFRIKDNVGCTKDTTVTLTEPTLLTASATSLPGTCNGNDGKITINGFNGTPAYTYSLDGALYQASNIFIVSGGPNGGAAYPAIKVKDSKGCIANASVNVQLIDNMVITPANDTTICVGQSVTFNQQVSTEANIFQWNTWPDPALVNTLNSDSIKNPTATPVDTTTYIVSNIWGVCSRNDTITINVLHKPIPFAGIDTTVCFDRTTAVLHGSASNLSGTVNYLWSDSTNLQTPHDAVTIATPKLTETYTLTVTDNYGCNFSVSDSIQVTIQDPVPAFAGNDTIAVLGQPHQLMASGGTQYTWTPAAPLNLATIKNPLATLDHDQLFQVTVVDAIGCVGTDKVFIQAYAGPAYHVPNAFSPNGDGLNDIFRVIPPGISYTEWFRIFNRYGELVFETNKWLKGWDGTYAGKKQPVGNYVWILKGVDKFGKVIEMKGTVLLIQ